MFAAFTFASLYLFLTCRAETNIYLDTSPSGNSHELSTSGTTNQVCAYGRENGKDVLECRHGVASSWQSGPKLNFWPETLDSNLPVYLVIFGNDRLWLDSMTVQRGAFSSTHYGSNDTKGWCLSTDPCHIVGWESFADKCGKIIRLNPGGTVEYVDYSATSYSFSNIHTYGTTNQVDTCVPHQIPLASAATTGDNWCSHAGGIHQDVPGCGRVCSDNAIGYRGVKNKGTWNPKSQVPCSECPAARWQGCTVPYQIPLASTSTIGDNWCSHAGGIHQDVPGCGRVCSDMTHRGVKNKGTWLPKSQVPCSECYAANWPGCEGAKERDEAAAQRAAQQTTLANIFDQLTGGGFSSVWSFFGRRRLVEEEEEATTVPLDSTAALRLLEAEA